MKNYWLDRQKVNEVVWMAHMESVNKWYVVKQLPNLGCIYLHKDGIWRDAVLSRYNKKYLYDTKEEAQAAMLRETS